MTKTSAPADANVPAIVTTDSSTDARPSASARFATVMKRSLRDGIDATKAAGATVGQGMAGAAEGLRAVAGATGKVAGDVGSAAYLAVGDLNGDGKVDEADWVIARSRAAKTASAVAHEAGELGKAVARHEIVKDAAAGAAVGALIAVPIPLVGPAAGAAVGAAIGMTRGVIGSGAIGDVAAQIAAGVSKPPARKLSRRKKPS